jgi:large subunit ribosomal protein L13
MKTVLVRKEDVQREWFHLDASEQILGRLAVKAARILMGKDKPTITPGVDTGDFVVVTNARSVRVTGKKETDKVYRHHTGHVGGLVEKSVSEIRAKKPEQLIELAVRRMLPKNTLGRQMFRRLKVYADAEHPHAAQAPKTIAVPGRKRS